jgi:putative acetyltransferase
MEIVEYESKYQPDFKRLNLEWLNGYNVAEDRDLEMLDDPEGEIIKPGGYIFLVKENEEIIGTAGLLKEQDHEFELVKMAVDPKHRGKGISKLLMDHCLQKAATLYAKRIFLFSNSQLKTALKLYEKYGFEYMEVKDAQYVTADIKMELLL